MSIFGRLPKRAVFSIVFLVGLFLASVCLPTLLHWDPNSFDASGVSEPLSPSLTHWFGTDDLGRDLLIRAIDGARVSLLVGIISVSISIVVGVLLGALSGFKGGLLDEVLMRLLDVFLAIPTLFLILTIQVMLKPSIVTVMVVIGLTSWMGVARLVRAEVLSLKERVFVTAARARGIAPFWILIRHILPHTAPIIIISAMIGMGHAILTESVLSFLGMGVQPPLASWGNMLQNSLSYMLDAPWMTWVPGIFITITVLALNFLGDGLREYWSPER